MRTKGIKSLIKNQVACFRVLWKKSSKESIDQGQGSQEQVLLLFHIFLMIDISIIISE
jgi:hypothetical protein